MRLFFASNSRYTGGQLTTKDKSWTVMCWFWFLTNSVCSMFCSVFVFVLWQFDILGLGRRVGLFICYLHSSGLG